ncbi:hypothetical protein LCGC14_1218110 [marine sediment metagenome]|uniref:Uncharacterized protein n=1 Tax=marine sediment metagenome TaxID=412755 RepID=A0A0F9LZE4_9ZZZZ
MTHALTTLAYLAACALGAAAVLIYRFDDNLQPKGTR